MNIFAHELDVILISHKKTLSSLYTIRSPDVAIPPSTVDRLKETLQGQRSATLNVEQLAMLQERLSLTDEEMRRLRAALLAEGVRRLLADRLASIDAADDLASKFFQMLLVADGDQMQTKRDRLLEEVRGPQLTRGIIESEEETSQKQEQVSALLEPTAEAYHQGMLWLEMARATSNWLARRGYVAHAKALLETARNLARRAPSQALNTPEQASWLALIEAALEYADTLG